MTAEERHALRQLYRFRCGYCGTTEAATGAELTVDHFQPRSRGGLEESENWVYCCHACNEFKGDFWQPNAALRILHPLRDDVAVHITEQPDGTLVGLTETGTFHIGRLRLNRAPIVARRREQRENVRLGQAVSELRQDVQVLRDRLAEMEQALNTLQERVRAVSKPWESD
jgi:hypothetical protein